MTFERTIECAQGYLELNMCDCALEELERLPANAQQRPEALQIRLHTLMRIKQWEPAAETGAQLCLAAPEQPAPFIHTAYCLHETGQTDKAKQTLQRGPESLTADPTFHYNLACYCATLGDPQEAQQHLERSFAIDANFRDIAKQDPDLKSLHNTL